MASAAYWAFVCNPKKWAIDAFLRSGRNEDDWGIDRHANNQLKQYREGQLAVVRVGKDRRSKKLRGGKPLLQPGIYAVCKILSRPPDAIPFFDDVPECPVYKGTGGSDEFSYGEEVYPIDWPTVRILYIRNYLRHRFLSKTSRRACRIWIKDSLTAQGPVL